ncbi:MAG: response regulator [Deltaproteobacteria bacterium]|nr:MAG: response regulator [Deltaproteobacteria bacterium]
MSSARILYIEDDHGQARLFQRKLERAGYVVELASNGEEGLNKAIHGEFDIVATDHELPSFDGMELLKKLREVIAKPPAVIMITGAGNEKIAVAAMKEGASDYLVKDVDGRYLALLPSVIDKILQQKQLAREKDLVTSALLQSEEKFRAMFEHSPIGMVACQENGFMLDANQAFCRLVGYEPEDIPSLKCWPLILGKEGQTYDDFLSLFDEHGNLSPLEVEFPHRDGTMLPVSVTGFFYKDSDGKPFVWLFVEDLRSRKEMEKRLMQSSKLEAIGELAANIAHEMNNPLGIISAKARLLLFKEKDNMSAKVESELNKIIEQTDRLSRLTRGLLDYSRPSFGRKQTVDLLSPLRKALDIVEYRARSQNVTVEEEGLDSPLVVHANSHEMEQVFLNLLLNGLEMMEDGGTLTIKAGVLDREGPASHVFVSVSDTGEGILPEIQTKIFEPFFTTKEEGRGTGLGLSICFGLVRSHQGTIEVQSVPGEGATFLIVLPNQAKD